MGVDCKLILEDTSKPFYYPGEAVTGTIIITSDSNIKVNGLKLHIRGKGNVKFTEREQREQSLNQSNSSHSSKGFHHENPSTEYINVEYSDQESYLDATLNIFGFNGMNCTINTGRSTYPFQFNLPYGLPSTFEGAHGSIKYSIEAVIGRSWAFDCKSTTNFQVVGILDLNNVPAAQLPVVTKASKKFGIFIQSGPLDIILRLPKSGAVPGEYVPFIAEIFNKSNKTVTECISLLQEIEYFARGKIKRDKNIVAEMSGEVLKPGADHVWQESIKVPQIPLSNHSNCRIINVKYEIVLEMKVSGILGINLTAEAPFFIGNVPIRNVLYGQAQPTHSNNQIFDPPPPYTEKPATKFEPKDDDFELI